MNLEFVYRRRTEIVLGVLSLFCFIALLRRWDLWVRGVKAFLFFFLSPTALALSQAVNYGAHLGGRIPALTTAFYESRVLRAKLVSHRLLRAELEEMRTENDRLRQVLHLQSRVYPESVAAEVVARDPVSWFSGMVVNRGERHGVHEGAPVVAHERGRSGLVGRVEEASTRTSKVLLLSDPSSSVSVVIGPDRDLAMLRGEGRAELRLTFIVPQAHIEEGHEVVTAGLGETLPSGIPVGRIGSVRISSGEPFQEALLLPHVGLNRVEEVLILPERRRPRGP